MGRKKAIITGGARRIGSMIAMQLAALGYDVCIHFSQSQLEASNLASRIRGEFSVDSETFCSDLSGREGIEHTRDFIQKQGFNVLVNNASIFRRSFELESDLIGENLNIHVLAPLILSNALVCGLGPQDKMVINMLDAFRTGTSVDPFGTLFAYASTKHMTEIAHKYMAKLFEGKARVYGLALGYVKPSEKDIGLFETLGISAEDSDRKVQILLEKVGQILSGNLPHGLVLEIL